MKIGRDLNKNLLRYHISYSFGGDDIANHMIIRDSRHIYGLFFPPIETWSES